MVLEAKSVVAKTLDAKNLRLKFKESSPFKDFIRNGEVVNNVIGDELDLNQSDLYKITFAAIQKNFNAYKAIKSALEIYISRMKAVSEELLTSKDETNIIFVSVPSILERLYEASKGEGADVKDAFTNTEVVGSLLKKDMQDGEYVTLLDGLTFDSDCNILNEAKYICNEFLSVIPTSNPDYVKSLTNIFEEKSDVAMMRMSILLHFLNKLIESPKDEWLADGVNASYYHKDVLPILTEFRGFITKSIIYYVESFKNLTERNIPVFGFSKVAKPATMYVIKEVYNRYLEIASEIEGASDAIYGILFKREFANANIEMIKNSISLLAEAFRVNMELDLKTGRRTLNIQLADYYTDYYLELMDNYIGDDEDLATEIKEKFLEDFNLLPTREEVVKFAYKKVSECVELTESNVALICLDVTEMALNKLQPYLGTYVRALSKKSFDDKVLKNGSLVLASLMEVTADMLFDQIDIEG